MSRRVSALPAPPDLERQPFGIPPLQIGKSSTPIAPRVPDKIESAARPFPPEAVRLLDGPFKDAMARDQAYLLSLDPDRLLHNFRVNAGLPSTAQPLGGWEAPDVELRGHSVGHYLSALALMYAGTGDVRFKARADAIVAELAKVQQALAQKGRRNRLPLGLPRGVHRSRRSPQAGLGALLHAAQDHGGPAGRLRALRHRAGARRAAAAGRLGEAARRCAVVRAAAGDAGDRVRRHERRVRQPVRDDRQRRAPASGPDLRPSRRVRSAGEPARRARRPAREHADPESHRRRARVRADRASRATARSRRPSGPASRSIARTPTAATATTSTSFPSISSRCTSARSRPRPATPTTC